MTPAQRHMQRVAEVGCCVCRRLGYPDSPAQVHHVAEGSGLRSDFAVAGLCPSHHTGASGFHTLGERAFCALYRVPGEREWGLLVWTNEDLERYS